MIEIKNYIPATNSDDTKQKLIDMLNTKKSVSKLDTEENTKPIDEATKKWNTNDRITNLFADKIEKDTNLKGTYAKILIGILICQLLVLNVLFVLKGCQLLQFADSTFNIFITGGIAEIFILVKTIVKYLFNDDLSELLKIILKANNYKFKENNENKDKRGKN